MNIINENIGDVEITTKPTFNRVAVLLYLTHLFVYTIVIWEGFFCGEG